MGEALGVQHGSPRLRRPLLGYAVVVGAATLWGVNGVVSKVILESGPTTLQVAELRITGAALLLVVTLALVRRDLLRVTRRELPLLVLFGVGGLAMVQLFYLLAIARLPIAVALLIEYLAPVLVALYARFFAHEQVRARVWAALALALVGLTFVLGISSGIPLDRVGVACALVAAVTFAVYILAAERAVTVRHPLSVLTFGLLFASVFWAAAQPWWRFPFARLGASVSLEGHLSATHVPLALLVCWLLVLGTVVPFALVVAALEHVSATRAGLVAMLEPVVATIAANAWLGEALSPRQLAGGVAVLVAIALAQTAR